MGNKYVSWRRVSTFKQSHSGLGLEAQSEIIRYFVQRVGGVIIADYSECYTGKELSGCVELQKAMAHAKRENAILVIAKSDRFRNCQEALSILNDMGEGNIEFCDLPHSDRFTLTLFWALAEREALITSIRTKQALAAKKARGETTGGASEKWRASYEKKSSEEKHADGVRRGRTVREHHKQKRDIVVFLKIIAKTFPKATRGRNPESWDWDEINCKEKARNEILTLMADYKELDGELFVGWNFNIQKKDNAQKLRSFMQATKKSYLNLN